MKNRDIIISTRFSNSDANLLREIAKNRGQDVSDFIRFSVRRELGRLSFLSDKEMKSLEIKRGT